MTLVLIQGSGPFLLLPKDDKINLWRISCPSNSNMPTLNWDLKECEGNSIQQFSALYIMGK